MVIHMPAIIRGSRSFAGPERRGALPPQLRSLHKHSANRVAKTSGNWDRATGITWAKARRVGAGRQAAVSGPRVSQDPDASPNYCICATDRD